MYQEKKLSGKLAVFFTFGFLPLFAFTMVVLVPFLFGLFVTFTDWTGTNSSVQFMGLANYIEAFTDPKFWASMLLTLKYVALVMVLTNVLALCMALLVTSGFKGQSAFRAVFFTPNLIGGVILGFIWQFVFSRVIVSVGKATGIGALSSSWLGDPQKAMWALVIVGVWQLSGYMMLIYIAGLTGVPQSVIQAAEIDGANSWQIFLKVKLPLMIPAFTISLFLTLQKTFMTFDTNLTLTKGGPYNSTELVAMHIYNEAFKLRNYGPGQAKAILFFVIVAVIALAQVVLTKRREVDAL